MGACDFVAIPWCADRNWNGGDWHDLDWWVHAHLLYFEMRLFPKLCAFNQHRHEATKREIRG